MKIGIVGLPGSGKTTVFNALTGQKAQISGYSGRKREPNLAVVPVPDERLDALAARYNPKKVTPARITYVDVAGEVSAREEKGSAIEETLRHLRPADALLIVLRNFMRPGEPADPKADLEALEAEFALTDLISVEKRLERLEKDASKGKRSDPKEIELLRRARDYLNNNIPLRSDPEIAHSPLLKGYAFLSAKPCIAVINSGDDAVLGTVSLALPADVPAVEIKGRIEMELAQLSPEEAEIFRQDFALDAPATIRLIQESYRLLGLISFFTVGEDEVRAWTVAAGTPAQKAAGVIHSDIEKGFIRAEVISCEDLLTCRTYADAQRAGKVRLEGKDYLVRDGDVINFRFNV